MALGHYTSDLFPGARACYSNLAALGFRVYCIAPESKLQRALGAGKPASVDRILDTALGIANLQARWVQASDGAVSGLARCYPRERRNYSKAKCVMPEQATLVDAGCRSPVLLMDMKSMSRDLFASQTRF